MSKSKIYQKDPKVQKYIKEMKRLIKNKYPDATFWVNYESPDPADPDMILLHTKVDVEDSDQVLDLVIDRIIDIQLSGIPLHVIPITREPNLIISAG